MRKLFYLLVIMFFMVTNALANDCQIKPTLKEYQAMASGTFPVMMLTGLKLKIETPSALSLSDVPIIYYSSDKLISFQNWRESIEGTLNPDILYLNVFGVLSSNTEQDFIKQLRKEIGIVCGSSIVEVKIASNDFRAFMRRANDDYINAYIIPNGGKGYLHFIQFRQFTEEQVGQIISTIH